MEINRVLLLGLVLVKSVFVAASQERCVPVGMLCEYLGNPLGIDVLHPRLRWHLDDVRDKAMQKACRVLVSTDSLKLADKNYADCWDTGKRKTETMQFVYNGKKLLPFTKYFGKLRYGIKMVIRRVLILLALKPECLKCIIGEDPGLAMGEIWIISLLLISVRNLL